MRFRIISAVIIFPMALFAQAGSSPGSESVQAGKLLNEIKADAEQIRSSALNLEKLAMQADPRWSDYDLQWNTIKPSQERIDLAMQRLERMQTSLSAAEQQAVAQAKGDVEAITRATHDLWLRLGRPTVDLKAPALSADARRLNKATRELIKDVGSAS